VNQSAFSFNERPAPAGPVSLAIAALHRDPLAFKSVTEGWLMKNKPVWREFYRKTEALRLAGRQYFGAKGIYESMRYDTAVADAEITYKLNNSHVSGLARLCNVVSGTEYFSTREAA